MQSAATAVGCVQVAVQVKGQTEVQGCVLVAAQSWGAATDAHVLQGLGTLNFAADHDP